MQSRDTTDTESCVDKIQKTARYIEKIQNSGLVGADLTTWYPQYPLLPQGLEDFYRFRQALDQPDTFTSSLKKL